MSTVHRTDAYLRPPPPYEPVASRIKYVLEDIVRGQLIITTGFVGYFGSRACTLIFNAVFVELKALSNPLFSVIISVGPIYSTLDLINFLGSYSSTTVSITVHDNPLSPTLSIIGPSFRTIIASDPLTILSVATVYGNNTASFQWSVTVDNHNTTIKSTSKDPSQFILAAYKLSVDTTYTITVQVTAGTYTVSASTTVYVTHGTVTAAIVGGNVRSVPVDKILVLDGSISYDADVSSSVTSTLTYQVN